jgi:hypothetical protein
MKKQGVFIVFLLLFFTTSCSNDMSFEDFKSSVNEINAKQQELFEKSEEVSKMIRKVNKKFPGEKITFDTSLGLSSQQEEKLLSLIQNEKDVTTKGLLEELLQSEKEIFELKESIQDIQDQLPKPYIVKRGDSHMKVAVSYLMDVEGLDRKAARDLVRKVALVDEMIPGFYIWLYYNSETGDFGTYVTQGDARVNPNRVRYSIRKEKLQEAYEKGLEDARQDSLAAEEPETPPQN